MQKKLIRWGIAVLVLLILAIAAMLLSVSQGEVSISLPKIMEVLQSKSGLQYIILTKIRIPRIALAFAIGGALSIAGALLQGIYKNPLVEPYTLGISGGAALGVALAIVTGVSVGIGILSLPLAGFAGAFLSISFVYFLSMQQGAIQVNRMLLIGVMVSFVSSSAMMLLMSLSTVEHLQGIIFWMMGSLDEPNIMLIRFMVSASVIGLFLSYMFVRPLNALRLGESKAKHLGVNTKLNIQLIFILASLLAGFSVSVAGIIGFVGLVIPQAIRLLLGSDYRILLLGSYLSGGIFLVLCDLIARTIILPNELPIGVITGIFGGISFIIILSRSRSLRT